MRAPVFLVPFLGFTTLTLGRVASSISLDLEFAQINTYHLPDQEADGSFVAPAGFEAPKLSIPSTVQVAGEWDPNDVATASEWVRFLQRGKWMGCLLPATDEEAGKAWPDPLNRTPKSASSSWHGTLQSEQSSTINSSP
jgi:hypothetical protein